MKTVSPGDFLEMDHLKPSLPQNQVVGEKPEAEEERQVCNSLSLTHSLFQGSSSCYPKS